MVQDFPELRERTFIAQLTWMPVSIVSEHHAALHCPPTSTYTPLRMIEYTAAL